MAAALALSPPSNASTSLGSTGTMMPSDSMSSATVTKMKASAARRTGTVPATAGETSARRPVTAGARR